MKAITMYRRLDDSKAVLLLTDEKEVRVIINTRDGDVKHIRMENKPKAVIQMKEWGFRSMKQVTIADEGDIDDIWW